MNRTVLQDAARRQALAGMLFFVMAAGFFTAATAATPASAITTITLERGCFGCADEGLLVLRRDGSATRTVSGNARQGRPDRTVQGRIALADFDKLAQLLVQQGFFALADSYEDPTIRDGAWLRVAVTTSPAGSAGVTTDQAPAKQVFSRDQAGPPALLRIVKALQTATTQMPGLP